MPLSFVETMRGTLHTPDGKAVRVDFHVRAEGQGGGRFALTGVAHASPWIDETTAEGSLLISLVPARIAYDVRFTARDGQVLRLHGAKRPTVLSPVRSMSVLPIRLSDESERVLAEGTMYFDLLELPAFLASALPGTRAQRQLVARRAAVERLTLLSGGGAT